MLLHASPDLTIYHITLSPGLQYPPHNHLMDALIGIYKGSETNFIYPVDGSEIDAPERHDVAAPAVVHMNPDTVHAVANTGSARSGALHVYLGNLTETHRHMWSPDSTHAEPFDNERYLAGARPIRPGSGKGGRKVSVLRGGVNEHSASLRPDNGRRVLSRFKNIAARL
ncbi:hypothetical protein [Mesorhizobium sp. LSJC269B00]|uniref:hypothetical protein n=1 Tax=Mesorhizobium sp. LSJC269B00 TaxID=1287326 RepID=UPI0003F91C3B|nr:hypothetical protein [Mesorhizobium sp. LSJC269B00]